MYAVTITIITMNHHIACFVSGHGFGHAARACAVMEACRNRYPSVHFDIFSDVPRWFFAQSLDDGFTFNAMRTDVGLIQVSSMKADLRATREALDAFYPLESEQLNKPLEILEKNKCRLILCDIAPMGIAVGEQLDVPSILIENFTWHWIYEHYEHGQERFGPHIDYLRKLFDRADEHIQTEPVCEEKEDGSSLPPIAREPKEAPALVREQIGVPEDMPLVMVSISGHSESLNARNPEDTDLFYVLCGSPSLQSDAANMHVLPEQSEIYHPDLMRASDVIIGKAGYSTLAEAYRTETPFGYLLRDQFPESPVLDQFIRRFMAGMELPYSAIHSGKWIDYAPKLIDMEFPEKPQKDGARRVVDHMQEYIEQ